MGWTYEFDNGVIRMGGVYTAEHQCKHTWSDPVQQRLATSPAFMQEYDRLIGGGLRPDLAAEYAIHKASRSIDAFFAVCAAGSSDAKEARVVYCYALRRKSDGRIKIGSSYDPESRRRAIEPQSGERLELLGCCEGGRDREFKIHEILAEDRMLGEWFKPTARVRRVVQAHIVRGEGSDVLGLSREETHDR